MTCTLSALPFTFQETKFIVMLVGHSLTTNCSVTITIGGPMALWCWDEGHTNSNFSSTSLSKWVKTSGPSLLKWKERDLLFRASVIYRNAVVSLIGMQVNISSVSSAMERAFSIQIQKLPYEDNTFQLSPNSLCTFLGRLSMGHLAEGGSEWDTVHSGKVRGGRIWSSPHSEIRRPQHTLRTHMAATIHLEALD